jgi:hypothetical protein
VSEPWNPSPPPPPPPMTPPGGYMPPPPMNSGNVLAKVQPPAIGLMVVGGIGILFGLWGLLSHLLGFGAASMPGFGGENEEITRIATMFTGTIGLIFNVLGLASNSFAIWAGMQMKSLKTWNLCVAGSIVVMIPCLTCYLIGIPVGIWALVILMKPDVKAAFTA